MEDFNDSQNELIMFSRSNTSHVCLKESNPPISSLVVPLLRDGQFTTTDFLEHWASGSPIVVSEVDQRLQGRWHPDDFAREFGTQKISPVDCVTDKVVNRAWTVGEFFAYLQDPGKTKDVLKLKVRSVPLGTLELLTAVHRTGHPRRVSLTRSRISTKAF